MPEDKTQQTNDIIDVNQSSQEDELKKILGEEGKTVSNDETQGDENKNSDNVPFHEHPRFKQIIDENKTLKQELEALKSQITKIQSPSQETKEIPEWFKASFGEDSSAWENFQSLVRQQAESILNERVNKEKEAEKFIENEIVRLKSEGKNFDEEKLMEVMEEYRPTKEDGSLDFERGLKILEAINATKISQEDEEAKAKSQTSSLTGEGGAKGQNNAKPSLEEIRQRDWYDI